MIQILGVVTLIQDYEVCKEGQILTPPQAKILELLDRPLATFKLILKASWTKDSGTLEQLSTEDHEGADGMETEEDNE